MSLPIVFREEAEAEFDAAFESYDGERSGLGVDFVSRVQTVLDRIGGNPLLHGEVHPGIRKGVVPKFPFCIYYRPHADRVEIIAVFHTSRDPKIWQERV